MLEFTVHWQINHRQLQRRLGDATGAETKAHIEAMCKRIITSSNCIMFGRDEAEGDQEGEEGENGEDEEDSEEDEKDEGGAIDVYIFEFSSSVIARAWVDPETKDELVAILFDDLVARQDGKNYRRSLTGTRTQFDR